MIPTTTPEEIAAAWEQMTREQRSSYSGWAEFEAFHSGVNAAFARLGLTPYGSPVAKEEPPSDR